MRAFRGERFVQSLEIGVYFRRTSGYWEVLQEEEGAFWAIGRQLPVDGPADHGSGSAFGLRREGETQPGINMSDCYSMQHQSLPPNQRGAGLRFRHGRVLGRPL
ncbi:hypothetical protein ROHU_029235 [Labeo rohita]|uniref:Uncharacterized protein n=1 Tax=Labeo rohita TaxID=84645 RepID=A0A498LZH7_LABRO|nr:hypothetical protein ROHU_029235 [Labeo rohita]